MHRSEIIRFRCCKSCRETRQVSEKRRDPHAKLSLSCPQCCNASQRASEGPEAAPSCSKQRRTRRGKITPQHQTQEKSELLIPNFPNPYETRGTPCLGPLEAHGRDFTLLRQPASRHPSPLPRQCRLTSVFPFLTSTSLSRIAARFGSSDSTDHIGGTAG